MQTRDLPPELAAKTFEIAVRRLADDLRYGQDPSPYLGPGVDYAQSRPFVDGDSVKDIDWRMTARRGRLHVKQYETVKSTPIYLVVDTSASMVYRSTPLSKHYLATLVAGGLALAALSRLSPVGLLGGGRQLHHPVSLSRAQMFQWLAALSRAGFDEPTRLAQRIDELTETLRSRHMVIVVSDLYDPGAVPALKRLAQRHDTIVLEIEDPAQRGRLSGGLFRGVEAETGRKFTAHGRSRWFDESAERPSTALARAGIDHLLLATDRPFVAPLRRFLADRANRGRNRR